MVLAKSGVAGIVGDRGDLGGVIGEGLLEGRQEMLRRDLRKRRGLERRLPGLQQRVCLGLRGGRRFARFLTSQFPFCATIELERSISRDGAFLGLLRLIAGAFS